jgi:hypothetical protein
VTPGYPVTFRLNPDSPGDRWGGLVFRNTTGTSVLRQVTIKDAFEGPDPLLENAAISAFNADLVLEDLTIEQVHSNPIITRYSDLTLTGSRLHSEVTGDLVNVKYGNALISDCRFTGNGKPDNDAIDYDGTGYGIVRNSLFDGFFGFNSDAIDIGEEAAGVLVDSVIVHDVFDKGVSVGQHSLATIRNSLFVNCNMGVAVKDSSSVAVENCVFYNTGNPVACYEKNPGLAGGNARVVNSILSNSYGDSYMADGRSALQIAYSLSDNLDLPGDESNRYGDPLFVRPTFFDFGLLPSSPALLAGYSAGGPVDMGFPAAPDGLEPSVMISQFFINGSNLDLPQYIVLHNPSGRQVDLSGYTLDRGVTATIPGGTFIEPGGNVFLTGDPWHPVWAGRYYPAIAWEAGGLSDHGEALRVTDAHGIVSDFLDYSTANWPAAGFAGEAAFSLSDPATDNHFGANWTTVNWVVPLGEADRIPEERIRIYPNPTGGILHIQIAGDEGVQVELFSAGGQLLESFPAGGTGGDGGLTVDLSRYGAGIYLLRIGTRVEKVVVTR